MEPAKEGVEDTKETPDVREVTTPSPYDVNRTFRPGEIVVLEDDGDPD